MLITNLNCTNEESYQLDIVSGVDIFNYMEILNDFSVGIIDESPRIHVNYVKGDYTGTCIYDVVQKVGTNKPIKQTILILTHSDMGEVLDYWNSKVKLNEGNYNEVSSSIRNHSRQMVEEYLQGPRQ